MLEERDINYEFYNFFRRKNIFNFISNKLFDYNNNDIFNGRYTKILYSNYSWSIIYIYARIFTKWIF